MGGRRHDLDRMALPDSVREVIGARVGRLGPDAERVLSTAAVIGRDFDLDVLARATGSLRTSCSTSSTPPPRRRWCGGGSTLRVGTASPTPSSSTRCTRTSGPPAGPARTEVVAEALEGPLRGRSRDPGGRAGPPLGQRHPAHRPGQGHRLLAPGGGRRPRPPWPPPTPSATTPRPSTSTPGPTTPIRSSGSTWPSGSAPRSARPGTRPFGTTLLDAARRAADLGDTERLVAAALANNRGFYSAVGAIDADKVEILEMALDRLAESDPDRALVLATLCSELAHGSPLERRQALADEAIAIAESSGDDATIVRVLNHLHVPLQVPALLETVAGPDLRRAWSGPSGSVTRRCCSGRRVASSRRPPAPGTSTRWTAASRSTGRLAQLLDQTDLRLGPHLLPG